MAFRLTEPIWLRAFSTSPKFPFGELQIRSERQRRRGQVFICGVRRDILVGWHVRYASNMMARCTTSKAAVTPAKISSWTTKTG